MREIKAEVVGLSHENPDTTDRQSLVRKCKVGDFLQLRHNPYNPIDNCAIEIYHQFREFLGGIFYNQIGFLSQHLTPDIVAHFEAGGIAFAKIVQLTGGTWTNPTIGVNIIVYLLHEQGSNDYFDNQLIQPRRIITKD